MRGIVKGRLAMWCAVSISDVCSFLP